MAMASEPLDASSKSKDKNKDFSRRLRTGLSLIVLLVIPMAYSPVLCNLVFHAAILVSAVEWLRAGANPFGLLVWLTPSVAFVDAVLNKWPGRMVILETLWIVLVYSDSAQLVLGRRFGRTPAISRVSPNKSVEGYLGGLLVAFVFTRIVHGWEAVPLLIILACGVVGDLYFSVFKRIAGIKDFSQLLGPHGGLCDRIDSFVFAVLGLVSWGLLKGDITSQDVFYSLRA